MHQLTDIRASLEVGYPENGLPPVFAKYRGRIARVLGAQSAFPYEDEQFDVVLMDGKAVSSDSVKEAHRVLKPEGCLFFIVPERTKKQEGFTLPDLYSMVRYGFHIVGVERPAWWLFGCKGRTLTICAKKKNWRTISNVYRPYL